MIQNGWRSKIRCPEVIHERIIMRNLSIDIETYSSADLLKTGVYKYAESPDFEILLFGYAVDGGEVRIVDLATGENIPDKILTALTDDSVIKWAFNASFERICLSRWLGYETGEYLNPSSWRCSLVWAAYMGLPLSLESVGTVLGLEQQKMREGKDLIRYFCKPCRPTKKNGGRTRNLYYHDDEKWELFKKYNKRDVETEMGIQNRLRNYPVPDNVWNEYHLSEEINDRGIGVDTRFVNQAIRCDEKSSADLRLTLQNLTSLQNPNSVIQMKDWLSKHGLEAESLDKKAVISLLKDCPEDIRDVLTVRQQLSKSSVRKYTAMQNAVCSDSRVRGMFQFYGANRTGRFAGRLVQLQNLPQNHIEDLAEARETIYKYGYDEARRKYDSVPDILSELIRTAFVPQYGRKFIVADFSAIEARVIAWYAGEEWRRKVFEDGGDIYCASASQMFKVPVVKNGVNGHLRQKGKIAELALGYGGSVGALKAMGAVEMGLTEEELQPLVNAWRQSNPNIVRFWWDVDSAAKTAIKKKTVTETHGIRFTCKSGMLFITLPSGRNLAYVKPRIGENCFGGESITYEGVGMTKRWERLESYGPKLVENIVQATARDILLYSMETLKNCSIVAHVHDELIIEADRKVSLEAVCEQMGRTPPWVKGLLLRADGYECEFYKKD